MKISALLNEAQAGPALSLDQDLMQRAKLKFPGYDSQQALSLYIADKAAQQQKTDAAQNNLINKQQNAIKSIGQELQDYEAQAQETDREVERLKQLSGALTTGSADRQQKAKVSADELEKLQKDLDALKSKPGMDSEKFKELEAQINAMATNPSMGTAELEKINSLLSTLNKQKEIGDDLYNKVENQLKTTQDELDRKEGRFASYIDKKKGEVGAMQKTHASEIKKYADIVKGYQNDIKNFDKFMTSEKDNIITLRGEIQQQAQEIEDMAGELASSIGFVKPLLKNKSATMAKNAIDNAKNSATDATSNVPQRQLPDIEFDDTEDLAPDQPDLFTGEPQDKNQPKSKVDYTYESKIVEQTNRPVGPVLDHDPKTEEWLTTHLPIMVRDFKKLFALALVKKNPTYNDHQIAYAIEDMIDILFSHEENPISKSTMNGFYSLVKTNLFQQAPETSTVHMRKQDKLFVESLDKTYSRMLDKIIGLPYI